MRRGLLGGTFDPIHAGHLDLARAARRALRLDQVVLLPSSVPPHRSPPRASAPHRFAMAALAIQDDDGLVLSDVELQAGGPSFTADTLDRLARFGWDVRQLAFILGADAFRDIESWKDYPSFLDRCHFVVVSRPGLPASALREALPGLRERMRDPSAGLGGPPVIVLVDAETAPVSSTDVRERLASGRTIEGLVPPAVAAYIARHGLYRAAVRKELHEQV
jgi:nicotinate-nucleotide adenylyltransferase